MLREKVVFPDPRPKRASLVKSKTFKDVPVHVKVLNLEYIENLLSVLENIKNPEKDEAGQEIIQNLRLLRANFEKCLKRALEKNETQKTKRLLDISDRMGKYFLTQRKKTPDSREIYREEEVLHKKNPKASLRPSLIKTTRFQDILELDSGYYTPQNIGNSDKSNSFMETFLSEKNQKQQDLSLVNNNEEALKEEIQRLNKNIQEKDEEIKNLQILNEKFENRVKSLEVALLRTKELIFSKEKECAEYHTLKKTKQNDSKILNNSLSMLPNGPQLLFNPTPEKPNEVIADNDYIIKHASCDSSSVLYENNQISINFEGNLENESYKMILNIKNKSDFLIQNFDLDIDSAFGFNFDVNPYNNEINPGDSVFVVINITLICYTHLTPTVFINFYVESQQYKLLLKIPINYCKFAKGIHSNFNDLWNEWEFLVFENESFRFRQEFSLDLYKKLIKLSQNAIVLCKEN